jgi:hypothetical protein
MAIAVPPAEAGLESLRTKLAAGIDEDFAQTARDTLSEAMKATKQVRVQRSCAKCGCTHIEYAPVMDTVAATNALKLAIEQTEGRPGVADQEQAEQLTVERSMESTVDAGHALALLDAGDLKALRLELVSSLPVSGT